MPTRFSPVRGPNPAASRIVSHTQRPGLSSHQRPSRLFGKHGTPESLAEYGRLIGELVAKSAVVTGRPGQSSQPPSPSRTWPATTWNSSTSTTVRTAKSLARPARWPGGKIVKKGMSGTLPAKLSPQAAIGRPTALGREGSLPRLRQRPGGQNPRVASSGASVAGCAAVGLSRTGYGRRTPQGADQGPRDGAGLARRGRGGQRHAPRAAGGHRRYGPLPAVDRLPAG